jgi:hypothetical protein
MIHRSSMTPSLQIDAFWKGQLACAVLPPSPRRATPGETPATMVTVRPFPEFPWAAGACIPKAVGVPGGAASSMRRHSGLQRFPVSGSQPCSTTCAQDQCAMHFVPLPAG